MRAQLNSSATLKKIRFENSCNLTIWSSRTILILKRLAFAVFAALTPNHQSTPKNGFAIFRLCPPTTLPKYLKEIVKTTTQHRKKLYLCRKIYKMNNSNNQNINLTKSKERIQKHGEVFTPTWVVNDMLNMLPEDIWEIDKTFLEPACGEGAFLVEIYRRKLERISAEIQAEWEWKSAIATSSIYGIELLEDNAEQCGMNLVRVFLSFYDKIFPNTRDEEVIKTIQFILSRNIIQGNALTYRKCAISCGNKCNKCELIVFSEWIPLENKQFKRKDYTYEGIVNASEKQNASKGTLFEEEIKESETGLVKEYKPVNWKEIRYATN